MRGGALGVDPALGLVDQLLLRGARRKHRGEEPGRDIRALPRRAGRGGDDRRLRVDARGQHLRAAPAGADAEAALGQTDEPRLLALRGQRADERVAVHGELKPTAERGLVDHGHRGHAQRRDGGERRGATLEVRMQAGVVERIDLREVGARHEDARAGGGEHQAGAPFARDGRASVRDRADQPRVQHHDAAARLRRVRVEPERDDAVGVAVGAERVGHRAERSERGGVSGRRTPFAAVPAPRRRR